MVFPLDFIIPDVTQLLITVDFLAHFYLAPNHQDGSLVNLQNFVSIQADFATNLQTMRMNFVEQKQDPFYKLLDDYQDLSTTSFKPKHGIRHYIPTECRPIQSRAQKPALDKLAVVKAEIEKLCELGVCRRGKGEWASPLMVA